MGFKVYFGGPDQPPMRLRDILAEHIAAVPAGGEIDWTTYYFRDRRLAAALLAAHRRGVAVRITLDALPRTPHANDQVLAMLATESGLGGNLRKVSHPLFPGVGWKPHLHEKVYYFSHPKPCALVGSFNPSGDHPETRPEVIEEILDQDRGHNFLVVIDDPALVRGLVEHGRHIHTRSHNPLERFSRSLNRPLKAHETEIHFWPRIAGNPISRLLRRFSGGARVRIAASHIKGPGSARDFTALARRGAEVEILAESTHRRIPPRIESLLTGAGIRLFRFRHPEGLPMHNKFIVIASGDQRWTVFGSCNWTSRSRWLNHEVGVISKDTGLFAAFNQRWETIYRQASEGSTSAPPVSTPITQSRNS